MFMNMLVGRADWKVKPSGVRLAQFSATSQAVPVPEGPPSHWMSDSNSRCSKGSTSSRRRLG